MKFELKNAREFICAEGIKGFEYNTEKDFENASVVFAEVTARHGKIKNVKCDRVYIVIDGKGEFIINDEVIPVEKNDVIIIPKNTPYDYQGKMKIFLVDTPAFDRDADVNLE